MGGRTCKWESVSYELQNNTPIEILEPRTVKLASMCAEKVPFYMLYSSKPHENDSCVSESFKDQKSMLLYNNWNQNGVQSTTLRILCENYRIWEMHDICIPKAFKHEMVKFRKTRKIFSQFLEDKLLPKFGETSNDEDMTRNVLKVKMDLAG